MEKVVGEGEKREASRGRKGKEEKERGGVTHGSIWAIPERERVNYHGFL